MEKVDLWLVGLLGDKYDYIFEKLPLSLNQSFLQVWVLLRTIHIVLL